MEQEERVWEISEAVVMRPWAKDSLLFALPEEFPFPSVLKTLSCLFSLYLNYKLRLKGDQKFSFVQWSDAHCCFQNSHIFLVPHLVPLSTRSRKFGAVFRWSRWSNLCNTGSCSTFRCSVHPQPVLLNSTVGGKAWGRGQGQTTNK